MSILIQPERRERYGLPSAQRFVFRLACTGRNGVSVSKYAVRFHEQHSAAKNDEDESKNTFAIVETPDTHTGYNVLLTETQCNMFSVREHSRGIHIPSTAS
jgi:hypothetical protein